LIEILYLIFPFFSQNNSLNPLNSSNNLTLNPYWVAGYIDAEGCFSVTLREPKNSSNWKVQFTFRIGVYTSEIELLKKI